MKDRELIRYEETDEGLLLFLKVHAKAKKNGITGVLDGRIKVSITQAPQKGKANTAILKLLVKELGLKRTQLQLIAGETSPLKTLRIEKVTFEEIASKLEKLTVSTKESLQGMRSRLKVGVNPEKVDFNRPQKSLEYEPSVSPGPLATCRTIFGIRLPQDSRLLRRNRERFLSALCFE